MNAPPAPAVTTPSPTDLKENFSLVLGGPLYQLFLRSRLAQPPLGHLKRRVVAFLLIGWLPLLVLSLISGHLTDGPGPFWSDIEVHARFLLALPILIIAELVVHQRIRVVVQQFVERGIVRSADRPRFDAIITSTMRVRNSVFVELGLIILVYFVGHQLWQNQVALGRSTWYAR